MDIILNKQQPLPTNHRGQSIGNRPIIVQSIFIRVNQNIQINRGGNIKNSKIFPHATVPFGQEVSALIRLSIHMPHLDLH